MTGVRAKWVTGVKEQRSQQTVGANLLPGRNRDGTEPRKGGAHLGTEPSMGGQSRGANKRPEPVCCPVGNWDGTGPCRRWIATQECSPMLSANLRPPKEQWPEPKVSLPVDDAVDAATVARRAAAIAVARAGARRSCRRSTSRSRSETELPPKEQWPEPE